MRRAEFKVRQAQHDPDPKGLVGAKAGWYVVLVGGNNEDMMVSETYTREADARRAAKQAKRAARFARLP